MVLYKCFRRYTQNLKNDIFDSAMISLFTIGVQKQLHFVEIGKILKGYTQWVFEHRIASKNFTKGNNGALNSDSLFGL